MPALIPAWMLSGVTMSWPQLVAGFQKKKGDERYDNQARADHPRAKERRHVGDAEEAVAKAVDHVEKRVGVRKPAPEIRQRVDGVEHAGKHRRRKDDEILEYRHLVDLFRPDRGKQAERPEQRGAENREGQAPER